MAGKILITPNTGSTTIDPTIAFQGAGVATDVTLRVPSTGGLSFEGTVGQLFSITDSMSGTIYSVNDISGIPSIEVLDTGVVKLAQYTGDVLIGTGTDDGVNKLQVVGAIRATGALTIPSIVHSGTTGVGDIGGSGATFATVYATTFSGVSTTAKYADVAENYQADTDYAAGTVLEFGGLFEVTLATDNTAQVAGIVSTNPAYLMNTELIGHNIVALALIGRVPCLVQGTIRKGDLMVSAGNGRARAEINPKIGTVIGKALEDFDGTNGIIEIVVGRV